MTLNIFALVSGLISKHGDDDDDFEEEEEEEEVPEAIASQSSSDTTSFSAGAAIMSPISAADFIFIPRRKGGTVTTTPDGLMPRKSIAELRDELNLLSSPAPPSCPTPPIHGTNDPPPPNMENEILFQHESYSRTSTLSAGSSCHERVLAPIREEPPSQHRQHDDQHLMLVELPTQPTRSWTPSTNQSNPFSSSPSYSSPTTTNNNNTATRPNSSCTWRTAESPNLMPGLTKTAVGNLFALQTLQQQAADPPGTTPLKSTTSNHNHNYMNHSQQWDYSPQEDRVEDMFSPVTSRKSSSSRVSNKQQQQQQDLAEPPPPQNSPTVSSIADIPLFSPCVLSNPRPQQRKNTTQHRTTEVIIEKWNKNIDNLQLIKARNQKHQKEDLLVQVFERLQDNVELIQDVESLYFNTNAKTINHALLVGLSESDRYEVLDKIDMILLELNQDVSTTEFFFSPGKVDNLNEFRQDHSKLKSALTLTKSFVELAIPSDEKETASLQGTNHTGYWKFLHHETIGLCVPDTPTAADSSFFSLPEGAGATTPMTSNVSLGNSTLTTRPQTVGGGHGGSGGGATPRSNNGLELRQALHILSNGLERIGTAIVKGMIGKRQDLIGATEEIKAAVAVLWSQLSTSELTTIVDAFEFIVLEEDEHNDNDYHRHHHHHHRTMDHHHPETILHAHFLGSGSIVSRELDDNGDNSSQSSSLAEEDDDDDDDDECDLRRSVGSIDEGYDKDEDGEENEIVMTSSPKPWQMYL